MIVWHDPDESLPIQTTPCAGLEALTGADFVVSALPINPVSSIQWHVDNGSLFVNIKRGYDLVINHEQRMKFAARTQALGVKPGRKIYLGVGEYRQDGNGNLAVSGYKALSKVPYSTFLQIQLDAINRGCQWMTIPSAEQLQDFITCAEKMLTAKDSVEIFTKSTYNWTPDDIWQTADEVPASDLRHILACGLPDFGPKKAQAVQDVLEQYHFPVNLFNALLVLTAVDEHGKRAFKVSGIGQKTHEAIRRYMFDGSDEWVDHKWNIRTSLAGNGDAEPDFVRGARTALEQFHLTFQELLKTMDAKLAYETAINAVRNGVNQLIEF